MRRKDREVTDRQEILAIMERCDVCHIALMDEPYPYIVTMNFGMLHTDNGIELYFHCAQEGKKMDLIRRDCHAAFEMDCSHNLIRNERACGYTMEFESVCGTGTIEILPNHQYLDAMAVFMCHYSETKPILEEKDLAGVCVLKLTVHELTAKKLIKQHTS